MIRYIVIVLLLLVDGIDSEMVCQHFNVTFNNRRIQKFTEAELASPDLLVYINVPPQEENQPFVFVGGNPVVVGALIPPGDTLEIYYEFNQRILLGEILVSMESYIDPNEKIKIDISGVTYLFSDSLSFHNKFDTPIMVSNLTIYSDSVVPGTVGTSSSKDYRVQDITFPRVCSPLSQSSLATPHLQSSSIFSTMPSFTSSQLLSSTTATTTTISTSSISQNIPSSEKLVGKIFVSGKMFHDKKATGGLIQTNHQIIAASHCMLEHCGKREGCIAINYNKEKNECELLSTKYSKEQNELISFPGWKYYETKSDTAEQN